MSKITLKDDWFLDPSRIGKGVGWRCRKCGTWVDTDSPLKCICSGNESPTVVTLQQHLLAANLQAERMKRELDEHKDLLEILANDHLPQVDGVFVGLHATRVNVALGRV